MPGPTPTLLITRPLTAGRSFVECLSEKALSRVDLWFSPLIEIQPLPVEIDFQGANGVIFSSSNGVDVSSGLCSRRDLPAYCVGHRTTQVATGAGWNAKFMGENADQLVAGIEDARIPGTLLHLSGKHVRGDISERLTQAGCRTRRLPVYSQKLLPLDRTAKKLLRSEAVTIAPLFSPRTARQFVEQCPPDANVCFVALSEAVAEPLSVLSNSQVIISDSPDAQGISASIEFCVNRLCRVESSGGAQ